MSINHLVGAAGQFAVLSELTFRGYSVAMPYPDEGEDCLIYDRTNSRVHLIQVKTAKAKRRKNAHRYQFSIAEAQITTVRTPDIYFALVMRRAAVFHPLILPRRSLLGYVQRDNFGSLSGLSRTLTVSLMDDDTVSFGAGSGKRSLTSHLRDYSFWPSRIPPSLAPHAAANPYSSSGW